MNFWRRLRPITGWLSNSLIWLQSYKISKKQTIDLVKNNQRGKNLLNSVLMKKKLVLSSSIQFQGLD